MTLAELLALFPDNDTGDIAAADVRAMVTQFFNDILANATAVSDLATALVAEHDRVTAVDGRVTAVQGQITTLTGQVNSLAAGVASLATAVSNLGARVDGHDTQIASIVAVNDIQAQQIAGLTNAIPAVEGNLTVTGLGGTGSGGSGTEDVCRSYGGSAPATILDGNPHNIRFVMAAGEPSANLVNAQKRVRFDPNSNPTGWVQGDNGIAIAGTNMKAWIDGNTIRQVKYNVAGRYLQVLGFNDSPGSPS